MVIEKLLAVVLKIIKDFFKKKYQNLYLLHLIMVENIDFWMTDPLVSKN